MTFEERNNMVLNMIAEFKVVHDRYTSSTKILTDDEWETYIHSMDENLDKYKGTNLAEFAGRLWMVFLDDTEYMQKRLKSYAKT